MAVTLNANTSTGFIATSDTSGVLQLQTGGTTAVTVDASQNVGIGTASPALKLDVSGKVKFTGVEIAVSEDYTTNLYYSGGWKYRATGYGTTIGASSGAITFNNTASSGTADAAATLSERMRIDSSGNVGIGTSTTSGSVLNIANSSSADELTFRGTPYTVITSESTGGMDIKVSQAVPMCFYTSNAERARIDSSGNLLVGTTSSVAKLHVLANAAVVDPVTVSNSDSGSGSQFAIVFRRNTSTVVGSIQTTNVATSYNTSSDYRLKENIAPMTGALAKVSALKPVTYTWKDGGSNGQGFIAHELQAVVPDCVTGEKDAVDADGNPVYQGIDTSFLVATLTAAIQEQQAIITSLTDRITALEGAK